MGRSYLLSSYSRPVSLTSQERWLQGTEFSDYNSYFHLSLHIQALAGTVVILKGAKVIKNMMRQGGEAVIYLLFFLLRASISTALSDHNSIFARIKSLPRS